MVDFVDEGFAAPADLHFDLQNPRAGNEIFASEDEAIAHLIATADIDEIVSSVLSAGWIDYEPLIVQRETNIVFEGNRRLAALRMILDEGARAKADYKLPAVASSKAPPAVIRVRWVKDRRDARSFIAFKHINGPAKWDAFAKARYAKDWLAEDGANLADVSKAVGDNHNTVLRLVNGLTVLEQATEEGFNKADITARQFNFSHLYTALTRPSVRRYLGLADEVGALLPQRPVPKESLGNLQQLMGWLFGQAKQGREHVVRSQNPDLGQLSRVIGEPRAMAVLEKTQTLKSAFEEVEPPSYRFEESLQNTAVMAERTLGLASHFNGSTQGVLLDTVQKLATSVRILRDEMRKKMQPEDDL